MANVPLLMACNASLRGSPHGRRGVKAFQYLGYLTVILECKSNISTQMLNVSRMKGVCIGGFDVSRTGFLRLLECSAQRWLALRGSYCSTEAFRLQSKEVYLLRLP